MAYRYDQVKRFLAALFVAFGLIGVYAVGSGVLQLRTDYQNFKKIVVWVAQKQLQEEQARQRQLQTQQRQAPPAGPVAPSVAPAGEQVK
jgi:hypothetical protein